MFHPAVVLRVLPNLNSRLVVDIQSGCRRLGIAKFLQETAKPDSLRTSLISSNVLSLSSRFRNDRLSATGPRDKTSPNERSVTTSRASTVKVPSIVRIGIDIKLNSRLSAILQHKVSSALKVSENALALLPVDTARIGVESTQSSHCICYVW